ncbi:FecCD family ABC transporter permease [Meiothermus ruber]|jgi:iron complex transport system permease protein|uniref:Transport system permease n=1 Tax=Meiothermus ruber (strain ATCC 35948 / DSM 1279 / VKM B-1258 / 21) TaxID=504728 RepID=D3PM63_MEIRD|nr:iron ABC transporter permease [Meiothermus ruber]ADD29169.1 transport system permease protein [Meiothermus ruber DSM 1279]AGK05381.1 transport system permease [Meiothermus ruber DSM 1279]MCL6528498.1 iron ABC transporter permease [Meiothermus ruber]GAO76089.1 transport system permease [Meiothermus ruber H328]
MKAAWAGLKLAIIPLLTLGLVVVGIAALGVGAVRMSFAEVLQALGHLGHAEDTHARILYDLRMPRILVGALCGAMFAASGAILQGVVRNPLASPDIVGVAAGAGLAAVFTLILLPQAPLWALPVGACLGGFLAFVLVYLLSIRTGEVLPIRLALIGVAVEASLDALRRLILVRADDGVAQALTFLVGTVYGADWERLWRVLPFALLLIPLALVLHQKLDVLSFGDATAKSLGMRLELGRLVALLLGVALASVAVTGTGILGFVGLIAPHAARLLVGSRFHLLLPVSLLLGAILVVVADTLARGLVPPLEIPAGLLTTLVGAPYFLYLMRRVGRAR